MQMTVDERDGNLKIIALAGRFDLDACDEIGNDLASHTAAYQGDVIIDLSNVDFIASMAIGMVMSHAKAIHMRRNKIAFVISEGPVGYALKTLSVDQVALLCDSVEEAIVQIRD